MSLRIRVFILFLLALVAVVMAGVPLIAEEMVTELSFVTPRYVKNISYVYGTGTIENKIYQQIYMPASVIPSDVFVEIGDSVTKGQVLANVDTELTKSVLVPVAGITRSGEAETSDIPELAELAGGIESIQSYASIYSQYGLDEEDIMKYIGGAQKSAQIADSIPSRIYAPISGIVTEVNINEGVLSYAGEVAISITDPSSYVVKIPVAESDLNSIAVGNRVEISGAGFKEKTYYGNIIKIYPTARKVISLGRTDTVVDIETSIEGVDQSIKPGFSISAKIATGGGHDLLTVPYEAVKQDQNNTEYVFVYRNGRAERQAIVTGEELSEGVEVVKGLSCNELVLLGNEATLDSYDLIKLQERIK